MCKSSLSLSIGHLGVRDSWLADLNALTSGWRRPGGKSGMHVSIGREVRVH